MHEQREYRATPQPKYSGTCYEFNCKHFQQFEAQETRRRLGWDLNLKDGREFTDVRTHSEGGIDRAKLCSVMIN